MDQSDPRPDYSGEPLRTELEKRLDDGESQRAILAELYRRWQGRVYGYARKSISNSADAEDLVQRVFLKMHANFDTMIKREPVEAWIFTVAHREIVDYLRQRRPLLPEPDEDWAEHDWTERSLPRNVEDEAEKWGRFGLVAAHLRALVARSSVTSTQLGDYWREVSLGMTQKELAAEHDVTQGRISQRKTALEREIRIALYLCVILGLVRPPYRQAQIREHLDLFDKASGLTAADRILLRRAGARVRGGPDGQPTLTPEDARAAIQDSSARLVTLVELHDSESAYANAIHNPHPHCILTPCAVHTAP